MGAHEDTKKVKNLLTTEDTEYTEKRKGSCDAWRAKAGFDAPCPSTLIFSVSSVPSVVQNALEVDLLRTFARFVVNPNQRRTVARGEDRSAGPGV
jgi:hypothetical protein